jgi:hypothetical protein
MKTKSCSLGSAVAAVLLTLVLSGCGMEHGEEPALLPADNAAQALTIEGGTVNASTDVLAYLQSIPGMTVVEKPSRVPGTRFFILQYDQPVDHQRPNERRFQQRLTLLHRSASAPMVLHLSGYGIAEVPQAGQIEVTALLGANQLTVEHRFFTHSTPQPRTWQHLTIRQSADDHHRIIQAIKPFYAGRWLSTGFSKGGMTAVYHRFFHPNDVDVTLPYVAPNSFSTSDSRYVPFVESRGSAECRQKLHQFQRTLLQRREQLASYMADSGATYDSLGADRAFEFGVIELPFAFWMYFDEGFCDYVPAADATDEEVWMFYDYVLFPAESYGDEALDYYAAYYYQSATQLGAPKYGESHLRGLLRYPRQDVPATYPPSGVTKRYDVTAMLSVFSWVYLHGQRMLFIYGENDPWSAGAFEVRSRNDSHRYFVPNGNHGTGIYEMPEPMRSEVLSRLFTWMEVPQAEASLRAASSMTDETVGWDIPAREHRLRL